MASIEEKPLSDIKSDFDKHIEIQEEYVLPVEKNDNQESSVDEKKLMRKIDWAIIPWISLLYLLSFLDRTSIGNARVR